MPDLSLGLRRKLRHVLLGVNVDAADEDAVDRFEAVARRAALGPAPDRVAGRLVLPLRENQRDVERDAGGGEVFECRQPSRRRGDLDHAVGVAGRPFLSQLDVLFRLVGDRQRAGRVFEQRIELEADVPVVPFRRLVDRQKDVLRLPHEKIGHLPGGRIVIETARHEIGQLPVEAAGLDQVGDDDRIGRGAGGAELRGWRRPDRGRCCRARAWCRWR